MTVCAEHRQDQGKIVGPAFLVPRKVLIMGVLLHARALFTAGYAHVGEPDDERWQLLSATPKPCMGLTLRPAPMAIRFLMDK